jgi:hypothetical protein
MMKLRSKVIFTWVVDHRRSAGARKGASHRTGCGRKHGPPTRHSLHIVSAR